MEAEEGLVGGGGEGSWVGGGEAVEGTFSDCSPRSFGCLREKSWVVDETMASKTDTVGFERLISTRFAQVGQTGSSSSGMK